MAKSVSSSSTFRPDNGLEDWIQSACPKWERSERDGGGGGRVVDKQERRLAVSQH